MSQQENPTNEPVFGSEFVQIQTEEEGLQDDRWKKIIIGIMME